MNKTDRLLAIVLELQRKELLRAGDLAAQAKIEAILPEPVRQEAFRARKAVKLVVNDQMIQIEQEKQSQIRLYEADIGNRRFAQ